MAEDVGWRAGAAVTAEAFGVRPAKPGEWPQVWAILQQVVRAGDTFTYPTDLDEATAMPMWMHGAAPSTVLVAVDAAGQVLGSAKAGANHRGPGAHVATASFIVSEDSRGMGVGRALVGATLEWAKAHRFEAIQFNAVAASNVGAVGLYESMGFAVVGRIPNAFRHPARGDVPLLVMHRAL